MSRYDNITQEEWVDAKRRLADNRREMIEAANRAEEGYDAFMAKEQTMTDFETIMSEEQALTMIGIQNGYRMPAAPVALQLPAPRAQ